jgi:hypothetical protein
MSSIFFYNDTNSAWIIISLIYCTLCHGFHLSAELIQIGTWLSIPITRDFIVREASKFRDR